jgi:hypothetical protein
MGSSQRWLLHLDRYQHHIHNPTGAAAAAGVARKELGKMSGGFAKGILLDLPVAMADGFHNMPVLYGDKRMERRAVKDWKSGIAVGGKVSYDLEDATLRVDEILIFDCRH